jgi:hypothetical protein
MIAERGLSTLAKDASDEMVRAHGSDGAVGHLQFLDRHIGD